MVSEPTVKVCGLTQREDARHAAGAGADFLGVILSPGFPRSVAATTARGFTGPQGPPLVAVLVNETVAGAASAADAAGASVIQLSGDESPGMLDDLRASGEWKVWKAVRPRSVDELRRAVARYAGHVDALHLDGWHPTARGGTGTRVSWDLVESMHDELPPGTVLVLAGGLTPENVGEAVRRLRPDVVDVSSGVEAEVGRKDPARVERFIQAARGAPAARSLR
jgi:phosphoribosylanthranilate isomerase